MNRKKSARRTLYLAQTVALILGVLAASWSLHAEEIRYNLPLGDTPYRGPEVAPVTIVEFIDFE